MQGRALLLLVLTAAAMAAGWTAVRAGGAIAPGDATPVVVAGAAIPAAELAGARDRAIERRWLEGEAAERGLRPARAIAALRGQVADAVAGPDPAPSARRLAAAFEAYHARWRARTACLPDHRDPHADRCGDAPPAAAGVCRWLGEATVCGLGPRKWLVVAAPGARPRTRRVRSRARALAVARDLYVTARRARERAAARVRAERDARAAADRRRAAADRRADAREDRRQEAADRRAAAERAAADRRAADAARARDPRLEGAALAAAQAACRRQAAASEPYLFAFGMQDVVGQAEGIVAARDGLARSLRAAAGDDVDLRKLRAAARRDRRGQPRARRDRRRRPGRRPRRRRRARRALRRADGARAGGEPPARAR